uniref:DUF4283 domain-containing protein n=1 Tax=Populus alba TaxID=43335 RepID=A0A4U5NND7_POPAL|nr:hypothetical protein D5086_0000250520 [Populus alba]
MSATSSVSDSYSFVRVLGMVGYKDLLRSFVEDDSGSQVEYAPLAMGSFLVENLQCVLVDSSLSKDDHASGLYLSGMELIYAFINWVATPYRVQLQISLIRVNSTVRPRFAHSVEGAQVSDIANFSGLTSSTANSAKVLRLCAKKAILLVSLCCVAMFAIEELHRAHHCGVYKDVSCCWFVRIAGDDEWLLFANLHGKLEDFWVLLHAAWFAVPSMIWTALSASLVGPCSPRPYGFLFCLHGGYPFFCIWDPIPFLGLAGARENVPLYLSFVFTMVAPIPNILETITVEDYSSEEGSEENLSKEEQLYFSFIDDDGEDMLTSTPWASPPAGLIPPPTSEGCSTPTEDIGGGTPTTKAIVGTSLASAPASLTIHDSGWLIYRFSHEKDKLSVLSGGPYLIYGKPLILHPMTRFFDFSNEEMSRVPVWVRFPNLPLYCWSPSCLSKIASVLGKPIQSDHMTSTLSRLSYARVLVEIDLREDLQQFVEISLSSRPTLHQKATYKALPKFCTHCSFIDPVETVIQDAELGPCVASDGWITVEPRQKSNKHTRGNTKGKEVITTEVMPDMNTSTKLSPPVNVNVFASLDA